MGKGLKHWIGRVLLPVALCIAGMSAAHAGQITYDFDSLDDGVALSTEYDGLHFAHATVLRAGLSLNEFSFPPHSGAGVAYDDGGAMTILFDRPVSSVAGYFTYVQGVTLSAYDSAGTLLATAVSSWFANTAGGDGDPGSLPNELLGVAGGADTIARLVIAGAADGASFTLDDLTVTTAAVAVPAPGSFVLVLTGLLIAFACGRPPRHRPGR